MSIVEPKTLAFYFTFQFILCYKNILDTLLFSIQPHFFLSKIQIAKQCYKILRNTFHFAICASARHIFSILKDVRVSYNFLSYLGKIPQFPFFTSCTAAKQEKPVKTCLAVTPHTTDNILNIKKVISVLKSTLNTIFYFPSHNLPST